MITGGCGVGVGPGVAVMITGVGVGPGVAVMITGVGEGPIVITIRCRVGHGVGVGVGPGVAVMMMVSGVGGTAVGSEPQASSAADKAARTTIKGSQYLALVTGFTPISGIGASIGFAGRVSGWGNKKALPHL